MFKGFLSKFVGGAIYEGIYNRLGKVAKCILIAIMVILVGGALALEYIAFKGIINMVKGGNFGLDIIWIVVASTLGSAAFSVTSGFSKVALKKERIKHTKVSTEVLGTPELTTTDTVVDQSQTNQSITLTRTKLDIAVGVVGLILGIGLVAAVFVIAFTVIKF